MKKISTVNKIYTEAENLLNKCKISIGEFSRLVDIKVIPIPKKATNGDVIKAMFPQDEEIISDTIIFKLNGSKCRVSVDWWNTPYINEQNEDCNNTDRLNCVLDKIRAEIEFEVDHRTNMLCAEDVLEIIDKYKAESEE